MQLHRLVELKLERESIVYNTFIIFKFMMEFFYFKEVYRMEDGPSDMDGEVNITDNCMKFRAKGLSSVLITSY
jgi:hypothetical protein